MTPATFSESVTDARTTLTDKAVEAYKRATHVAHDTRHLKSLAADVVDDGKHAAKRAFKAARRRMESAADLRDEALYRVKREPLMAVGLAFGVGLFAGAVIGWASRRRAHHTDLRTV